MSTAAPPREAKRYIAWAPLLWIAGLHLGALLAFVPAFFSWSAVAVCVVLIWVTAGLGICMTYHRLLTHRSFAVRPRWLEYFLTAVGCCACEGGAVGWVADHRKHHAYSDDEHDPHSPERGLGWAHLLWWMTPEVSACHSGEHYAKWAPDLARDRIHMYLDRYHYGFPIALGVALYALGGMPWLVWGGFLRTVFVLQTTWLVNSASHRWGYRSYETRDKSTNLWWVALLTFGEGWHNNHHALPTSARHGLRWWEVDVTFWAIRGLSLLGLTHSVKIPSRTQRAVSTRAVRSAETPMRSSVSPPR